MKNSNMRKGIFFLVVALALLGNAFGIFEITTSAFKLVLSAVLLTYSLSSIFKRHFTDGLVMLSFVYLLNEKVIRELFNFNQVNGWMLFWGALFLGIGLDSIFKRNRKFFIYESKTKSKREFTDFDDHIIDVEIGGGDFTNNSNNKKESYTEDIKEDTIRLEANFTDRTRYINVDNLTNGYIETNFGALRVYFDQTTFNPNGANIKVDCNFGKLTLFIPRDVRVVNNVKSVFGANMGESGVINGAGSTVVIEGDVTFGGFKIIRI